VNNLLTLVDTPDAILALGPAGRGTEQAAFFDKYAFPADKCAIEDVSHSFRCFEVIGPDAAKVVRTVLGGDWELPGVGQCVPSTDCYVYGGGSLGYAPSQVPVYSLILSSGSADGIAMSLAEAVSVAGGIFAKGEDAWDSLRVLRGRPDNGAEFAPPPVKTAAAATAEPAFAAPMADSPPPTIPKATPFDLGLWSTVHLDKGCYLGQEMLMRLSRVSKPRQGLYGLRFDKGTAPSDAVRAGAPVALCLDMAGEEVATASSDADNERGSGEGGGGSSGSGGPATTSVDAVSSIGVLTSLLVDDDASPAFGLALVKPSAAPIGTRVSVGGAVAEVVDLPYATRAGQQAGGALESDDPEASKLSGDAVAAAAAAKEAEVERKKAKLAGMEAKLKALGLLKEKD